MREGLLLLLSILLLAAQLSGAQLGPTSSAALPTLTITREDVVQESLECLPGQAATNDCLVFWQSTQEGAKKVRGFRAAHVGQRICLRIGTYETPPSLVSTNRLPNAHSTSPGQCEKTLRVLKVSPSEVNIVVAALKRR